jgi:hypothetical protein
MKKSKATKQMDSLRPNESMRPKLEETHHHSERPGKEVKRYGRVFAKDIEDASPSPFVTGHDENIGLTSFANMPAQPVIQEFPRSRQLKGGFMDDTLDDVDAIDNLAEGQRLRKMSIQK